MTQSDFVYQHVAMAWATAVYNDSNGDRDVLEAERRRFLKRLGRRPGEPRRGIHFRIGASLRDFVTRTIARMDRDAGGNRKSDMARVTLDD